MTLNALRRHTGSRRGNVMVEFAIGASVLLVAFAGTFQFGYTFLEYNMLENAVVRGARYASLVPYDSATSTPSSAFQTAVQNMVLYGSPTGGGSPVLPGLSAENVSLAITFADGVPSVVTVSITNYSISAVFGNTALNGKPSASFKYQGLWSPV